jgi:zinc/manganese transport system substrate-binding protein
MLPLGSLPEPAVLTHPGRRSGALALGLVFVVTLALPGGASDTSAGDEAPSIVATTEMLGWLVRELAGAEADVVVLMHGVDPHAWEPSARDVETLLAADLVVANGLGLEEGLHDVLEQAGADGVVIFEATDHIELRDGEAVHEADADQGTDDEGEHAYAGADPHFWLDPLAMRDVAIALVPVLRASGVTVVADGTMLATTLEELDTEARTIMAVIPPERRRLVTGHESMGYFADRYDFDLVGAVVPGLSSQGEVSAGELAELIETIRREGVPAIFTGLGTPVSVAEAVADETGASIVGLPAEQLPEDGSYLTFIRQISTRVAEALRG